MPYTKPDEAELRERLTREQYEVTQKAATERAFTGIYWDEHGDGIYRCIVCNQPLFSSTTKFESGTGWPSFYQPISEDAVATHEDRSFGMTRVEVVCGNCGAHLGHLFPDGPGPTGLRYCMNSCSLDLDRDVDAEMDPADDPKAEATSD
jgi:peptide-methionine (R)-S-oxide reductase